MRVPHISLYSCTNQGSVFHTGIILMFRELTVDLVFLDLAASGVLLKACLSRPYKIQVTYF